MTRKRRRLYLVAGGVVTLGVVSALVLNAMSDSLVFFYSPTELYDKHVPDGQLVRIGGLVAAGSVAHEANGLVQFKVTDGKQSVAVDYRGGLPDLFREGQGVVVEGALAKNGSFNASEVLAKHDENYMPKEVVDALKKSGRWQEGEKTGMAQ
jgi:cytochrome c-type biogenesis protein CcmE